MKSIIVEKEGVFSICEDIEILSEVQDKELKALIDSVLKLAS